MAYPIKAIPTLYGEEARRFQEMADETERKYDNTRECKLNCVKLQ